MSKNILDTDFEIIDGLPKKGKPKLLSVKIKYGRVGSGSLANLITDEHIYRVKTGDYIGGQVWECDVLETVKRKQDE